MKHLALLLAAGVTATANASVVITEYVEGGGYNKAVEITNFGSENVDLAAAGYTLTLYSNGASESSKVLELTGTLVPNSSIVVYNSGLATADQFPAPLGIQNNTVANFNGDDALVLANSQGVVDSFGRVGEDPGSAWQADGFSTKDKSLRRSNTITEGDTVIDDDFSAQAGDWVVFDKDTLDGLGCGGESACTGEEPKPIGGSGGGDTGGGDDDSICTNCPDISKVKDRSTFNDGVYYETAIAAESSDKATFRAAVSADIGKDVKQLTYTEAWTALTYTDEDPSNPDNIFLIYKGNSIAKKENGSGSNANNPDSWNREHVWPKSHGFPEKSQLGYTDIHHLRPADWSMNSTRSDNDFGEGGEPVEEAPENKKNGSISFEPRDSVKGDVARMMFYMDVRYEAGTHASMPDLRLVDIQETERSNLEDGIGELGKLCTLLAWHEQDPVDDFEIERNNEIYEYQGNRNPFIDHPEWVEKAFAGSCEDTLTLSANSSNLASVEEGVATSLGVVANLDNASFSWTQTAGTSVTLTGADSNTISFTAPSVDADTELSFKVVATSAGEQTAETTISLSVTNKAEPAPELEEVIEAIEESSGSLYALLGLLGLVAARRRFS